jgi:hypothetical protein
MKNDNMLIENIRNGFNQIIQYEKNKGELHSRAEEDAKSFAKYLEGQTIYTKEKLKEVIQKINYETLQADSKYNDCQDLEFWRGVDDFGSSVCLTSDDGVDILEGYEPVVIGRYDNYVSPTDSERILEAKNKNSIKIDIQKFPISLLGYYEYKFNETALFYAWLAYIWQEIEGFGCGLRVKTIQNNSIAIFSLNDFLDGDFSAFAEYNNSLKVERFFPRDLSIVELYQRASQTGYPFNPYKNYWRYFEKENEFMEIVTYEFSTGIRSGKLSERISADVKQIIKHESSKSSLMYLTDFTNRMIFESWEEKLRPLEMPLQMNKEAFDFEIWTGVNWSFQHNNVVSEQNLREFEKKHRIKLPVSFFHYTRMLNGRQYNSYSMYFPINELYTVEVKKFYHYDELSEIAEFTIPKNPNYLWIGELKDFRKFGICIDEEGQHFEKIVIEKDDDVEICDYSFAKFTKYAQSRPVQPELFAAEENDINFLRKRLDEGWDYNTEYSYQYAVNQAAEFNSHEALELLLKAGARLENKNYRSMTWYYDENTMEILDKYQKE